jgi:hypothetical protein
MDADRTSLLELKRQDLIVAKKRFDLVRQQYYKMVAEYKEILKQQDERQ